MINKRLVIAERRLHESKRHTCGGATHPGPSWRSGQCIGGHQAQVLQSKAVARVRVSRAMLRELSGRHKRFAIGQKVVQRWSGSGFWLCTHAARCSIAIGYRYTDGSRPEGELPLQTAIAVARIDSPLISRHRTRVSEIVGEKGGLPATEVHSRPRRRKIGR